MGPLAVLVYFIIWSLINGPLTNPLAKVVYVQDKREGDFRFSFNPIMRFYFESLFNSVYFRFKHMNIRTNAESIAFYNSGENELMGLNKTFKYLLSKQILFYYFFIFCAPSYLFLNIHQTFRTKETGKSSY